AVIRHWLRRSRPMCAGAGSSNVRVVFPFLLYASASTEIYTLSLHDALPISGNRASADRPAAQGEERVAVLDQGRPRRAQRRVPRSEEHTSELQSRRDLVCRLLLEKKKSWSNG